MEEKKLNSNILIWVIVVLLVIIAVMWFLLGKNMWWNTEIKNPINTDNPNANYEEVSVKVIKDDRSTLLDVDWTVDSLKELPSLKDSKFEIVDFADAWVKDYMIENEIKFLPAIIFSTNNFDTSKDPLQTNPMTGQPNPPITQFLVELPSWEYSLLVWADFDPFLERSEKGFTLLTQDQYNELFSEWVYVQGSENAKITWLEYSELECPYCAKLYNDWTPRKVKEKYWDDINLVFNHFPLSFHANAEPAAEILECMWEQKASEWFYALLEKAFADEKSDKAYMIDEAVKLWANKDELNTCLESWKYKEKITEQMSKASSIFWISWTPWNVLINNETLEFEMLNWAYPFEAFESIIDRLK